LQSRVSWLVADYADATRLVDILQGVHTVLSFIVVAQDKGNLSQRNLIDACVKAGVKRFAPSDWAGFVYLGPCALVYSRHTLTFNIARASTNGLPWYAGKTAIEQYLKKINEAGKVCPPAPVEEPAS
jgi:hypothetical protein